MSECKIDPDVVGRVVSGELYGRGVGKSTALACTFLSVLDIPEYGGKSFVVTARNSGLLRHFKFVLRGVAVEWGFDVAVYNEDRWRIDGKVVVFWPYDRLDDCVRGFDCVVFDADDVDDWFFNAVFVSGLDIGSWLVERREGLR